MSIITGISRKTLLKKVCLTVGLFGIVLYVGGWATGMIGDRINPGVDSFCSGKTSSCGIIMMVFAVPIAALAGIIALFSIGKDTIRRIRNGEPSSACDSKTCGF